MRDISKNIRDLRMKKEITQDELAEQLFVTRQTVSNYETGRTRPDIDMLIRIAEALSTDVNTVIYGIPVPADRKQMRKKAIIGLILTALLAVSLAIFVPYVENYGRIYFIMWPIYIMRFLVKPLCFLLMGWTLMQFLGLRGKLTPLRGNAAKWGRYALWLVLLILFVLILPFIISVFSGSTPDWVPRFWTDIAFRVLFVYLPKLSFLNLPVVMLLIGAGLWLCGFVSGGGSKPKQPADDASGQTEEDAAGDEDGGQQSEQV